MTKFFSFLLAAFSVVFLTGCFDITEEITVNKNGGGQYINKIDASKFAEQMQAFAAFDTTGEMIPKLKYSLDSTFSTTWGEYKKIKGISNVKIDTSKAYIYILTMDFENVEALNKALNSSKGANQQDLYAWEKGKVSRKDLPLNMGDLTGGEDESQKEMLKGFMQDMRYTIIYHLPNSVKEVDNKQAKISEDKKTVTIESNLLDVMDSKVKLSSIIEYKK